MSIVLRPSLRGGSRFSRQFANDVPKSPTHVLIRAEQVREQPSSNAQVGRSLAAGTQVRVVQLLNGWAVIAREGEKLGYVPEEALLRLQ
jgi:hypothetical protein